MNIFPHPPRDRALQLLAECDLPWSDLDASDLQYFLGCGDESAPNGIIGLGLFTKRPHGSVGA